MAGQVRFDIAVFGSVHGFLVLSGAPESGTSMAVFFLLIVLNLL